MTRARLAVLVLLALTVAGVATVRCRDARPDTDEAAVCRAVQQLVDALNDADAPAAVAAVERVRATGRDTNNRRLSSRAAALADVSNDPDRQPLEDVNEELVSIADACNDAGRSIRNLR